MRPLFGVHWAQRGYDQARELGFDFCWLNADTFLRLNIPAVAADLAAFTAAGLQFVLQWTWTEDRLLNRAGHWAQDVATVRDAILAHGLGPRLLAVQYDDEFYERAASGYPLPQTWPSLTALLATLQHDRTLEHQALFGALWPPHGVGCAATGGMPLPTFASQGWWGCNFYLGRPQPGGGAWYIPTIEAVHQLYAQAASAGRPLMPVLGIFGEPGQPPRPLADLAQCYLPVLHQYATWAVGVFLLHHPGNWDPAHGTGQGILDLPPAYAAGVRWLTRHYTRPDVSSPRATPSHG